jgi:predicted dienelactone hydrolase
MRRMTRMELMLAVIAIGASAPAPAVGQDVHGPALQARPATGVGFASITIHDPVNGGSMFGYVFYPSSQATGVTRIGPYEVHATAQAPVLPGAKPLVVISHGHRGSALMHHDLAVYLASHGFVAATLQHPKDNDRDWSGAGTAAVWVGRPIQVKATISRLLQDARWKKLIDPSRIGVAGFSAGGYTALMVVGAVPEFGRFIPFCEHHPDAAGACPPRNEISAFLSHAGYRSPEAYQKGMEAALTRWGKTADPRVKAAFAMAPMGVLFDKQGLAGIKRPVFLYDGQDDRVAPLKYNTLRIAPLIKTLAGIRIVPKAGHFVFLSPCSPEMARDVPKVVCKDPPGVNRVAVHRRINADALAFFRKTLPPQPH